MDKLVKNVKNEVAQKFRKKLPVSAIQLKNNARSIMDVLLFLDIPSDYASLVLEINKVEKKGYIEVDLDGDYPEIIDFGDWVVYDKYNGIEVYSDKDFKEEFEKAE